MQKEILELEKILEQEIEACSQLEKYIVNKKNYLIKGDVDGMVNADLELEKYNSAVEKLEEKRKQLYPEGVSLTEIIENIPEKQQAQHMKNLKNKLNDLVINVKKENNASAELIKHSLNIVQSSISSIVNVLVPENSHYNNKGKVAKKETSQTMSSVTHEV